jgi:hypothetical protein
MNFAKSSAPRFAPSKSDAPGPGYYETAQKAEAHLAAFGATASPRSCLLFTVIHTKVSLFVLSYSFQTQSSTTQVIGPGAYEVVPVVVEKPATKLPQQVFNWLLLHSLLVAIFS